MRSTPFLALAASAALLALPSTSRANFGASLTGGAGVHDVNHGQNIKWQTAFELSPFYEVSILRFEVPVEMTVSPARSFAVRPGLKVLLPFFGLYLRAGYGLGNLGGDDSGLHHSLIVGAGKQFMLLDTFGLMLEGTAEPQLSGAGAPTNLMVRFGVLLDI